MKNKTIPKSMWLLLSAIIIYILIFVFEKNLFISGSKFFLDSILKIIPALAFVFVLMTLVNYFVTPEKVLNFSKRKGARKWFLMSFAGILSTGPPFLWYPMLSNLKEKGLSKGLITTYLYNRSVVISFVPLLIFYFSLKYVIVFYIMITLSALIQGLIMNKLPD